MILSLGSSLRATKKKCKASHAHTSRMVSAKRRAHRRGKDADPVYNNRTQELRAAWRRLSDLYWLKEAFKKPFRFHLSKLKRRSSMDYEEYDRVWQGSAIGLYKSASDGDKSAFTDSKSDAVSRSEENIQDPSIQFSPSQRPPAEEALNNSPLNLCHRCAGINAESLSAEFGYEHGLLSELPSRDQLDQIRKYPDSASAGFCKACVVFMEAFYGEEIGLFAQDRHRLVLHLKGLEKEGMQEEDHFSTSNYLSMDRSTKVRSISTLVLSIMNLDVVEELENYTGPQGLFSYPYGAVRHVRRLTCFTDMDDPNVPFGITPVRSVGDSTSSAASFDVAAAWLSQCLDADPPEATNLSQQYVEMWGSMNDSLQDLSEDRSPNSEDILQNFKAPEINKGLHLGCENISGSPEVFHTPGPERPTRLIEIGSGSESGTVRLIENNENGIPYATLSYCWGKLPSNGQSVWLTTTTNVNSRRMGMQKSDLPQTLQDSITISEKLGIQHIWIDALCIIQDSEDDWAVEAAKMGGIYLGSIVTIVAAASSSSDHGCFNQRSASTIQVLRAHEMLISIKSLFSDGRVSNLHIMTEECQLNRYGYGAPGEGLEIEDAYQCQVSKGPWINRAWTMQEHVLSPRLLFYTSQMLLWECGHCRLSEDRYPQMQGDSLYPLQLMSSGANQGPDPTLTADTWYLGLIEGYSHRQITFDRDRMVAIGALAKATSWGRQIPYVAGLWSDSVRTGLMWYRDGPGSKSTATTCPSWSWASQSSPVSYEFLRYHRQDRGFVPRVLDVHVEAADVRNPFGDIKSGYLMLHTKIQTARVLRDFLGCRGITLTPYKQEIRGLFINKGSSISLYPEPALMDDEDLTHEVLVALIAQPGLRAIVLLLIPPRLDAEEYRRVGIAQLEFPVVGSVIMQWTTRTIKIV